MSQCRAYEYENERCTAEGETFNHDIADDMVRYTTTLCPAHKRAWKSMRSWPDGRQLVLAPDGDVRLIWASYGVD